MKGFTLIEILAVVIILGVLSLIVTFSINKVLTENMQKTYNLQIESIISGAKMWANKNVFELPDAGENVIITLGELKNSGFLKDEIINPKTKKAFDNNLKIKITSSNNNYKYEILE